MFLLRVQATRCHERKQVVDDEPEISHRFERIGVLCGLRLVVKHDQVPGSLIECASKLLVQNHLRKFLVYVPLGHVYELGDAGNLDARVRLNDAAKVLLEEVRI